MKARLLAAVAITIAATGSGVASAAPAPHATLIDVDVIHAAHSPAGPPSGGANCSNDGAATGRYVLTGWAVQGPKTALFNTTTLPAGLSLSATVSALQGGFSAYSQASAAPAINVANSVTSSLKPTANHQYELMFGKTGGQTLAVTYTWRWSTGEVESDTLFNTSFRWGNLSAADGCDETAGAVYDVGNIATHEFGHTYGLDHPSGARFETMYAYGYSGETLKSSLASGDVAGANAVY
jgi:hypothetical protein